MSTEKPRVSIVGLGLIGASLGLALRQAEVVSQVVGHDPDREASNQAKRLGAVDRTDWNLISACEKSDLIILATPLSAIQPTLEALGPHLRPGSVVMDTASLKVPVLAWADEFLPEGVHFIGGNPIIAVPLGVDQATASARADLFRDGLYCLTPAPNAHEEAVQLAMNLVGRLGAKPLFIDPAEHDGLLAAVEHLPHLLALTLLDMAIDQPTWRELRKVAGAPFDASTYSGRGDPAAHAALATANRENLVRWIDAFSASLAAVRQALVDGDEGALAARFEPAILEREQWLQSRAQGTWDEPERVDMPERMGFMDLMLGGLMPGRKKRDD